MYSCSDVNSIAPNEQVVEAVSFKTADPATFLLDVPPGLSLLAAGAIGVGLIARSEAGGQAA